MRFNKKTIYIVLFAILYICVGLVSTIHAISFFSLANAMAIGVILAFAFEIGQAAVLFSILTDIRKRKKLMPWLLMTVLTIVQVMGNVYSSYKYLITNSEDNLRFFKEPIFIWTDVPDATANVLLVYLIGGVLPIVSLLMTAMLTSYLEKDEVSNEYEEEDEDYDEESDEIPQDLNDENPGYMSPYKEDAPINEYEEKHLEEDEEKHLEENEDNNVSKIPSHSVNI